MNIKSIVLTSIILSSLSHGALAREASEGDSVLNIATGKIGSVLKVSGDRVSIFPQGATVGFPSWTSISNVTVATECVEEICVNDLVTSETSIGGQQLIVINMFENGSVLVRPNFSATIYDQSLVQIMNIKSLEKVED